MQSQNENKNKTKTKRRGGGGGEQRGCVGGTSLASLLVPPPTPLPPPPPPPRPNSLILTATGQKRYTKDQKNALKRNSSKQFAILKLSEQIPPTKEVRQNKTAANERVTKTQFVWRERGPWLGCLLSSTADRQPGAISSRNKQCFFVCFVVVVLVGCCFFCFLFYLFVSSTGFAPKLFDRLRKHVLP